MKAAYTNHHEVPITVTVTRKFGGSMTTAHYAEEHLQPEGPMLRDHSWTTQNHLHASVHHHLLVLPGEAAVSHEGE